MPYKVITYYKKEDLPDIESKSFFHQSSSFDLYSGISYCIPFMLICYNGEKPIGALFAVITRINRLFPFSIFKQCYVNEHPACFDEEQISLTELSKLILDALLKEVEKKVFFIKYASIGNSVFGYRWFRENKFFSIKWTNVNYELSNLNTWEYLHPNRRNQINKAIKKGVTVEEINSNKTIEKLSKILQTYDNHRVVNNFPLYKFLENIYKYYYKENKGKIFIAYYNKKIIGGIVLGLTNDCAYSISYWGKTKTHKTLYPTVICIWTAIKYLSDNGYKYIDFLDTGILSEKSGKPRFLLQFGCIPTTTRRWYHFNYKIINKLACLIWD